MTRCNDVPIMQVLDKLWISYFQKSWPEYWLYDWSEKTGWRAFNTDQNLLKDFSGKWRVQGGSFEIVKWFERLESKEVFEWFESNFASYKTWSEEYKKPVLSVFNDLECLNEKQQQYLLSRWIDYDKVQHLVKNYDGAIGCLIYENNIAKWLNARTLSSDHKYRFKALSWYSTKWIYQDRLDKKLDYVVVVEWLIDFLTLRQYTTNVVWLKSSESWIEEIQKLSETYEIIFVFDNDDAWSLTKEKISFKYKFFDWSSMEYLEAKDVNDIQKHSWSLLLDFILANTTKEVPINRTIEKYLERQNIIKERWKLGHNWPLKLYNEFTQWIVRGKVYGIGAFSNTWKSKLAYHHCAWFLKEWYSCMYVSIEESEVDMFWHIHTTMNWKDWNNVVVKRSVYEKLVCVDNVVDVSSIDALVKQHNPDILFIDYAQWLWSKGGTSYEKHANIAYWIQRVAIENSITVFCLHQLANSMIKEMSDWLDTIDIVHLKGAGEYFASNDVILVLAREDDRMRLKIVKNKLWRRWQMYDVSVDWKINRFELSKIEKDWHDAKF